jgi:hypothetical protein
MNFMFKMSHLDTRVTFYLYLKNPEILSKF